MKDGYEGAIFGGRNTNFQTTIHLNECSRGQTLIVFIDGDEQASKSIMELYYENKITFILLTIHFERYCGPTRGLLKERHAGL